MGVEIGLIELGIGLIELWIGLIELGIGLIELGIGLIELGIGLIQLGIVLKINNVRRTVLARVSGLVIACWEEVLKSTASVAPSSLARLKRCDCRRGCLGNAIIVGAMQRQPHWRS